MKVGLANEWKQVVRLEFSLEEAQMLEGLLRGIGNTELYYAKGWTGGDKENINSFRVDLQTQLDSLRPRYL